MKVGVTGHQALPKKAVSYIERRVLTELAELNDTGQLAGVTSLAEGADQLFAFAVLSLKGQLEVVIPSADYESTLSGGALKNYRQLLAAATSVRHLPYSESSEEAFFSAGKAIVDECERLFAIWDGKRAKGLGGTADIVSYAKGQGVPVTIIWPRGLSRE
jgi:hypothetical protein